eukprot:407825-Rhodomonas_salina.1
MRVGSAGWGGAAARAVRCLVRTERDRATQTERERERERETDGVHGVRHSAVQCPGLTQRVSRAVQCPVSSADRACAAQVSRWRSRGGWPTSTPRVPPP